MLGRPFFADMENDPFFEGHREHMRNMDRMFQNPFGSMFGSNPMLQEPRRGGQQMAVAPRNNQAMSPFGFDFGFNSVFSNMNNMMANMERTFESARNNPNAQVFSQSAVYSYTNTGSEGSRPRVYEATSSTLQAPGGVKETRKTVRDSERGDKMAIGHHIRDRAHIIQKTRRRGGDIEEEQELINLEESEKERFDREFQEKKRESMRGLEYRRRGERSDRKALPDPNKRRSYRDRERREKN
ncbi:myeloid leukemia factor 2-like [Saccostrea echinata]|uniref:myeloid leukemia factor 2-like n=1 Tax=Saccostrea echinata TaxID=191078 RepID=UPI002A819839|nr:myeloid leukemia factor 2-like [Saccostrea echinata]